MKFLDKKWPKVREYDSGHSDFGSLTPYVEYEDLFTVSGMTILDSKYIGDYQGDLVLILRSPEGKEVPSLGISLFGYGSCSGCDALQAAMYNEEQMESLRESLLSDVDWFSSAQEALDFLGSEEFRGRWQYGSGEAVSWLKEKLSAMALNHDQ